MVLHCRLEFYPRIKLSDSSHIRYATSFKSQQQTVVKFHGVLASHWKSLASAPEWSVQGVPVRDSEDLVTPFMQVAIQTTRHLATLRELQLLPPFNCPYPDWNRVSDTVTGQTSPSIQGLTAWQKVKFLLNSRALLVIAPSHCTLKAYCVRDPLCRRHRANLPNSLNRVISHTL